MCHSPELEATILVDVLFIMKKLLPLWFLQVKGFSNALAVENEEMLSHLCKKSRNLIFEMQ